MRLVSAEPKKRRSKNSGVSERLMTSSPPLYQITALRFQPSIEPVITYHQTLNSLEKRMKRWQVREEDLQERFVLGSGSGGQKINKTSSRVYLKHLPSGIEVTCQESRSREKNRETARHRLCEVFERRSVEAQQESRRQRALHRYQKRRPSKASKAETRRKKQQRSDKKSLRRRISE